MVKSNKNILPDSVISDVVGGLSSRNKKVVLLCSIMASVVVVAVSAVVITLVVRKVGKRNTNTPEINTEPDKLDRPVPVPVPPRLLPNVSYSFISSSGVLTFSAIEQKNKEGTKYIASVFIGQTILGSHEYGSIDEAYEQYSKMVKEYCKTQMVNGKKYDRIDLLKN